MEPMNLLLFPDLPLLKVFRYLDDKSLIRAHRVCKFLRRFVVENRLRFVESPFDRLYLDQITSRDGLAPALLLVMRRIRAVRCKSMGIALMNESRFPQHFSHLFWSAYHLLVDTSTIAMKTDDREPIRRLLEKQISFIEWTLETSKECGILERRTFRETDFEELFSTIKFRVGDVNGASSSSRIASNKVFVREIDPVKKIDEEWRFVADSMRKHYKFFERHS